MSYARTTLGRFFLSVSFLSVLFFVPVVHAAMESVELGDTIQLGEFLYEDDYTASTEDCTITIYDPSNTLKVNAALMSENANGWHYYDYAVGGGEATGKWPAFMSCGTLMGGDLVKADKSFLVTSASTLVSDVAAIKAKTDTILWTDVTAIKTKTDTILWSDVTAIKTQTDTIDWTDVTGLVTLSGDIKTKTDTIDWTDIVGIKTNTDTIFWADITAIQTATDTIDWSDVTAIKTKTDTIDWADIDTLVSGLAGLVTEIGTGNISAIKTATDTIVWSDVTSVVTNTGAIKLVTDTIDWSDVTAIKTQTDTID